MRGPWKLDSTGRLHLDHFFRMNLTQRLRIGVEAEPFIALARITMLMSS